MVSTGRVTGLTKIVTGNEHLDRVQDALIAKLNPALNSSILAAKQFRWNEAPYPLASSAVCWLLQVWASTGGAQPAWKTIAAWDQAGAQLLGDTDPVAAPSVWSPWNRPAVADPRDDEFEQSVLDPAWGYIGSVAPNGSALDTHASFATAGAWRSQFNASTRKSWFMMQGSTDGGNYGLSKAVSLGSSDLIWCRFSADNRSAYINDNARVSLALVSDIAATHYVAITWNRHSGATSDPSAGIIADTAGDAGIPFTSNVGSSPIAGLVLEKSNTTYFAWAITSDGARIPVGSAANANAMAYVWLQHNNSSSATYGNPICGFDFVRFGGQLP